MGAGGGLRPASQLLTSRPFGSIDMDGGVSGGGSNPTTPAKNVPCPFSVEPYSGDIAAGGEQTFTVRFAPQEVRM